MMLTGMMHLHMIGQYLHYQNGVYFMVIIPLIALVGAEGVVLRRVIQSMEHQPGKSAVLPGDLAKDQLPGRKEEGMEGAAELLEAPNSQSRKECSPPISRCTMTQMLQLSHILPGNTLGKMMNQFHQWT
jgi:hypothetical protein